MALRHILPVMFLMAFATAHLNPFDTIRLTRTNSAQVQTLSHKLQSEKELTLTQQMSRISTYISHLREQPLYTVVESVLETASPRSEQAKFAGITLLPSMTGESWYRSLPTEVRSYIEAETTELAKLVTIKNGASHDRGSLGVRFSVMAGLSVGLGLAMILL